MNVRSAEATAPPPARARATETAESAALASMVLAAASRAIRSGA